MTDQTTQETTTTAMPTAVSCNIAGCAGNCGICLPTPTGEGSGRTAAAYDALPLEGGPTLAMVASEGPAIVGILNPDEDPVELFRQNLAFGEGKVWVVYLPEHPLSQWDDPQRPDHAVLAAITGNGPTSQANAEFFSWCLTHKQAIVAALSPSPTAARGVTGLPTWEELEALLDVYVAKESAGADSDAARDDFLATLRTLLSAAEQAETAGRGEVMCAACLHTVRWADIGAANAEIAKLRSAAEQGERDREDARLLDALEADVLNGEQGALLLHDGWAPANYPMHFRGLGFGPNLGRSLRDALRNLAARQEGDR